MAKTMRRMTSRARGAAMKVRSLARRTAKKFFKGMKSLTRRSRKDFTTKKSSKVFNRKGHYKKHAKGSRKTRKPYRKGGMLSGLTSKLGQLTKAVPKPTAASQMKNVSKLSGLVPKSLAASKMKSVSKLSGLASKLGKSL